METYEVKIPKKRVAVLIGEKGKDKRRIESSTDCKILVNSEGEVVIKGEESLKAFECLNIVKTIGRGCRPSVALRLIKEDHCCEIIDITDYSGKNKDKMKRIKGRIIGKEGRIRKIVEKITGTNVVVYGKTICIVGEMEEVNIARNAVHDILKGAPQGPVFSVVERKIKELKKL
ncbi:MAG: RNA-processing protein [Nanoarchaeota archaeon]|nr:RNA-processing protein [Nanoarchaeota archaeon]|tara:strand:+ start:4725 stop:5246 length:522 start_codon:yes stop_codon:yes gene_type:complete